MKAKKVLLENNNRHLETATPECINALKITETGEELEAGGIKLSKATIEGKEQYEMTVYFNRDLSPCNTET